MSEAIGGPMGLLAPPPRERVVSRAREKYQRLLIAGGIGWLLSDVGYVALIAATLNQTPPEGRRLEQALWVGLGSGVVLLHLLCWAVAARFALPRISRHERTMVATVLAALWFVCGGWISVALVYVACTSGLDDFKVGPQLADIPYVLAAAVPLLSVFACCLAAWLGTRGRVE